VHSDTRTPIRLGAALGTGKTELAAFDAALRAAGCGNYNLVRLSSVIPPHTELVLEAEPVEPSADWGHRLYCVYAAETTRIPGAQAWAGVGWVRVADGDGRGLFVEHEGPSEEEVRDLIATSLEDMCAGRPERFTPPECSIIGTRCTGDEAVCALVIAKYQVVTWADPPRVVDSPTVVGRHLEPIRLDAPTAVPA
jgi:arginine decarboxylase